MSYNDGKIHMDFFDKPEKFNEIAREFSEGDPKLQETLLALWEKDQISVKELGEKLYLDSGTLTPLLNKLKSKGLIEKTKQEKDGRELILSLTKKGIELKEKALNIPEAIAQCVKLEKDEAIEFFRLLNKVLQGFYGE